MYHDLRQRGARIPQDLFIVGFDNHNVKLDSECYLTSIQHSDENLENYYKNIRENKDFTFLDRMDMLK